jgi:hypothetical protein
MKIHAANNDLQLIIRTCRRVIVCCCMSEQLRTSIYRRIALLL